MAEHEPSQQGVSADSLVVVMDQEKKELHRKNRWEFTPYSKYSHDKYLLFSRGLT